MRGCLVIGLGLLLGITAAWAGNGDAAAPTPSIQSAPNGAGTQPGEMDRTAIERLVGNLGSRSRSVRESAQKRLVEIGLPAVRALRAAAGSDDSEVRERATAILKAIREASEVCVQELGKVPRPFKDTHLFVSPNGQRLAYILKLGGTSTGKGFAGCQQACRRATASTSSSATALKVPRMKTCGFRGISGTTRSACGTSYAMESASASWSPPGPSR